MKNLYLILAFLLFTTTVVSQDTIIKKEEKLKIGLTVAPPFVIKENNDFEGLSISSWQLVNRELDAQYEFVEYPSLQSLLSAVETGEVDLSVNPITVTDQRMEKMAFSQPYFISYTGIAKKKGSSTWRYLSNIFSWNFISAILILVGVIFIFGFLVWIFERKKNKEEFGPGTRGILQGFWWSAVTMTTVGYGDKSPRSLGGRIVGFIWMFMAIIMISTLTAGIASSLTVQNMQDEINSVQDLSGFEVTTIESSSAQELLDLYSVNSKEVTNVGEGIDALLNGNTSLLVYDQPILNYIIEQEGLEDELEVLQRTLKKDYYSYSFPKDSDLVDRINPLLISTLKTMEWNNLTSDYK